MPVNKTEIVEATPTKWQSVLNAVNTQLRRAKTMNDEYLVNTLCELQMYCNTKFLQYM